MLATLHGGAREVAALAALAALATLSALATGATSHAKPRRTVTIAAVGHLVVATEDPSGRRYLESKDGLDLVNEVAPLVADADLSIANLAAPISTRGAPKLWADGTNAWAFRTPPRYAPALTRLGLDVVLAANNHILDFGPDAYGDTLALLDRLKIGHVGRIDEVFEVKKRGVRVAVVGFTQPYRDDFQSNRDLDAAAAVVAKAQAGADIVIALVHGGGEGRDAMHVPRGKEYVGHEYRGQMVDLAHRLVEAGADLVLGFGAHHPRAMELYRGRIIAYALGNFLTNGPFDIQSPNMLSMVLRVTLDARGELASAEVVPLRLRHPGIPYFDPKGWSLGFLRRLSKADFPESRLVIRDDGVLEVTPELRHADGR
jgi:hypothetical protein